ncbi:hypothetical protein K4K49_009984 [Colletotrichum sp. SAR 10_70]|nr:hypothetical protein K4K49_009984 [Colletotrichum sp. SAR 10_70]KAI8157713.1 hypothetical protein K4K50_004609 [Colletotrichum sp. SAR 10_71]KAI8178583.1 hypothetical protein K4K51_004466 [Colletotrichum sp. SAR 10_75]KAI8218470.1 hypothetical protein K4K54_010340 [Colletotrichum sp. SAR 10_86]KAJ4995247.1 hypothetical protein K4K48_010740 [Colletotrichum sp. SAR 10_66]
MAEVIGIVGSVVGILAGAELAYQKLQSIRGLPEAFAEVVLRVPLAQQILRDVEARSREASEDAAKALLPVVKSCKGNAETLKTTLERLDPGESTPAWNLHVDRYISLIKSHGKKGRIEDLMKKVLQDIYTLASHHAIRSASSEQLDCLKEAIEKVGEVKKSVADELLEDSASVSISHGGQGPMLNQVGDYNTTWNNFGSGNINNVSGDAHFGPTAGQ